MRKDGVFRKPCCFNQRGEMFPTEVRFDIMPTRVGNIEFAPFLLKVYLRFILAIVGGSYGLEDVFILRIR